MSHSLRPCRLQHARPPCPLVDDKIKMSYKRMLSSFACLEDYMNKIHEELKSLINITVAVTITLSPR